MMGDWCSHANPFKVSKVMGSFFGWIALATSSRFEVFHNSCVWCFFFFFIFVFLAVFGNGDFTSGGALC